MLVTVIAYTAFLALLVAVAVIDLKTLRIPNYLTGAIVLCWIAWRVALALTGFPFELSIAGGIVGSVFTGGALLLTTTLYEAVTKKRAMGGGDIKLMFASGLFLGLMGGVVCLLVACVASLVMAVLLPRLGWRPPDDAFEEVDESEGEGGPAAIVMSESTTTVLKDVPFGPAIAVGAIVAVILRFV